MKKAIFALLFITIFIVGCSENNQNDNNVVHNNNEQNEENNENETNNNNEINDAENNNEPDNKVNNESNNEAENNNNNNDDPGNNDDTDSEASIEGLLKDRTEDFFLAQRNHDVDGVKAYLASTATYDEASDSFYFDDITYPHEMERFEIDEEDLNYRYIHLDADYVTVGYAAINYEEEYSFVIDFTWIEENGEWKIKDMDMNK